MIFETKNVMHKRIELKGILLKIWSNFETWKKQ